MRRGQRDERVLITAARGSDKSSIAALGRGRGHRRVALVLVFAFALSWVWITLGLVLRTPNAVMSIGFVILFPLTFMSNIFVDPDTMPSGLHAFADLNPISHLATAARGLMQGTATTGQVLWVLGAAAALTALFAPLTMRLYQRRG